MEKDYTRSKAWKAIITLFFVQCIADVCVTSPWFDGYIAGKGWEDLDIAWWFCYYFPPVRMLDFLMGCNAGYLFLHRDTEKDGDRSKKKYTCLELFAILLAVSVCVCLKCVDMQILKDTLTVILRPFWASTVFVPSSIMLVWLFAINKGGITKVLNNHIMVYIGNISAYAFLIHSVVLNYLGKISDYIIKNVGGGGIAGNRQYGLYKPD